jgi:hypothetical protein
MQNRRELALEMVESMAKMLETRTKEVPELQAVLKEKKRTCTSKRFSEEEVPEEEPGASKET